MRGDDIIKARTDILEKENLIRQWINEDFSKAEICRRLSCGKDTLKKYLEKMGINYNGNQGGEGIKTFDNPRYIPFSEYIKTSKKVQTNKIRQKLFKEGLKEKDVKNVEIPHGITYLFH